MNGAVANPLPGGAERLGAFPELAAFIDEVGLLCDDPDPERFWAAETAFSRLLRSPFLPRLVQHELERVAREPGYSPGAGLSRYDLGIVQTPAFSLSVELFEPHVRLSTRLYTATQHVLIGVAGFAGAGEARYEMFEQPDPWPNEVLDRSRTLVRRGVHVCPPGGVMRLRAGIDAPRLLPVDKPVVLLLLASRNVVPLRWEYDEELVPLRAMAAMNASSRLEYTARLLAELGQRSSVEPLRDLFAHPDHFVRWAAVRAVMKLDFDEGAVLLRRAEDDPHPHVRSAARAAVARLVREGRLPEADPVPTGAAA